MKTLLVLARHPALAAALRAVLDPERIRLVAHADVWEAESLLRQGFIDACVLDADLNNIQPVRLIEQLRRLVPHCPLLIYTAAKQWEWEEEAYLLGVSHVLTKPVRARLFNNLLERLWTTAAEVPEASVHPPTPPDTKAAESSPGLRKTLEVLRDFSRILCHSLCSEALLKQFLLLVREIIGVNRAAIFLRLPANSLAPVTAPLGDRRLHAACAIGIAPGLLEHFELSLEAGIGGYIFRQARILKSNSEEAGRDREAQKEFELLGAQVAIPILDRESLIGVAVFDDRLTGEPFANEELSLIFHLLEQLGLAIKNTWLHDQLASNHRIMTDILSELVTGIVVIGRNLEVLHANVAARAIFSRKEGYVPTLEFSDLPQVLASKVFETLKSGQSLAPFKHAGQETPRKLYEVRISPFHRENAGVPNAVLLLIEDVTKEDRAQQLEIESANLRLIRNMAEHLAHEIGNSIVPLSTHQQLMVQKYEDLEFRDSLTHVMADGVKRISRLSSQMLFLARDAFKMREGLRLSLLIEEAFAVAKTNVPEATNPRLRLDNSTSDFTIRGDPAALKHALSEVLLNALQANPTDAEVRVRLRWESVETSAACVHIEIQDAGDGFTEEAQQKAFEPFYTTRNVGLGLGLTVARRIIEGHAGRLEIVGLSHASHGLVSLTLPLSAPFAAVPAETAAAAPAVK